ncbi:MAG: hypothetical protein ACOYYJ_08240 [Chloroflexota bacterium]
MNDGLIHYAIGYLYSLLIGTWLIYYLADYTGKAIGEFKDGEYYRWTASIVGITERLLYTSAILLDKPEFIGIWFLLKVASRWRRWGENDAKSKTNGDEKSVYRERANFNSYLINTGLSLAYGILGGEITIWMNKDSKDILTPFAFGLGLILLNAIFIEIAYYKYKQSENDREKRVTKGQEK